MVSSSENWIRCDLDNPRVQGRQGLEERGNFKYIGLGKGQEASLGKAKG
jgi:hypothetical protein